MARTMRRTMRRLSAAVATITIGVSGLLTLGAVPAQAKVATVGKAGDGQGSLIVHTNVPAINARPNSSTGNVAKSLEKLSSGYRINRAGDDAAGLAISEKMRGQISGLDMALRNANDGISLIQTAEGGLAETHAILQRMRELAAQAANGTNSESDRSLIDIEIANLREEIDRINSQTEFNTKKLLDGRAVELKQGDPPPPSTAPISAGCRSASIPS